MEEMRSISKACVYLYHGALSAGLNCTQLREFSSTLGLRVPREDHFYEFQHGGTRTKGWIDAILHICNDYYCHFP
jgi:hypothetical protein